TGQRRSSCKQLVASGAVEVDWLASNQIQPCALLLPGHIVNERRTIDGDRETRSGREAVVQSPVVQQGACEAVVPCIGQVIGKSAREVVPHVEIAIPAL